MLKAIIPKIYGFTLNLQSLISKKAAAKKAFKVYCTVRKGEVSPLQETFLEPAKHELVQIPTGNLQTYHWPGTGEKVLLVHGWESNVYRWRILIKKLQEADFDIFAFDAPGNGNSSGAILHHPLYETALQKIKQRYTPSYLIGHSMGGMTVMYNEYKNPDARIKKIISIASPSEYSELMRYYKTLLSLSDTLMSELENYIKTTFGFQFHEFSTAHFAKTNTKKGLLIHDKRDLNTPYWCSEQVHANWKNSEFITTEGLGHSIQDNNVNKQIIDFLKS
jgi:pimeloyl-ACP methyl ester carboxylesterase